MVRRPVIRKVLHRGNAAAAQVFPKSSFFCIIKAVSAGTAIRYAEERWDRTPGRELRFAAEMSDSGCQIAAVRF